MFRVGSSRDWKYIQIHTHEKSLTFATLNIWDEICFENWGEKSKILSQRNTEEISLSNIRFTAMFVFPARTLLFYGYYFNLNHFLPQHTCNVNRYGFPCFQILVKLISQLHFLFNLSSDWHSNSSMDWFILKWMFRGHCK